MSRVTRTTRLCLVGAVLGLLLGGEEAVRKLLQMRVHLCWIRSRTTDAWPRPKWLWFVSLLRVAEVVEPSATCCLCCSGAQTKSKELAMHFNSVYLR
mmetsp:Transcript_69979/g.227829  ORF Transcript_69979/g.227829 Transcript_69979/m.227829 type:complete len:97 (-) Transcript_69979:346-636(-)